jgi:type IV secretory pathway TrbD component
MTMSSGASGSRIITILLGVLTAIIGFVAFNVVDGVFGVAQAILGIAACIATTVFVFRRSPPPGEDTDV